MIFERDAGICAKCSADCEKVKRVYWAILDTDAQWFYADVTGMIEGRSVWEADHIQEHANGGLDLLVNLQTLCRKCHNVKSANFLTKGDLKRVPLNVLIAPATRRALLAIQAETGESQGEVVDRAVALLAFGEAVFTADLEVAKIIDSTPDHPFADLDATGPSSSGGRGKASIETWGHVRGIRPKGDKTR